MGTGGVNVFGLRADFLGLAGGAAGNNCMYSVSVRILLESTGDVRVSMSCARPSISVTVLGGSMCIMLYKYSLYDSRRSGRGNKDGSTAGSGTDRFPWEGMRPGLYSVHRWDSRSLVVGSCGRTCVCLVWEESKTCVWITFRKKHNMCGYPTGGALGRLASGSRVEK